MIPKEIVLALIALAVSAVAAQPPTRETVLRMATAYVADYEQAFSLLVSEERW